MDDAIQRLIEAIDRVTVAVTQVSAMTTGRSIRSIEHERREWERDPEAPTEEQIELERLRERCDELERDRRWD